ncbi:hypothetical protein [Aeromonas jandaei]|uniref:hypothetical protein n=1 Tax=Aeromonas jandaei TaxID=650 RepID=UPI003F793446
MKRILSSYQINLFVKEMPVTPTPDFVNKLFNRLSHLGLFPGVGTESNPEGKQTQFLRMATSDDKISIGFNSFALNIIVNDTADEGAIKALEFVEQIYNALVDASINLQANRLSFVVSKVNRVDVVEAQNKIDRFIVPRVNKEESIEWDSRFALRKMLGDELVNMVSVIRHLKASVPVVNSGRPFDAIVFDRDVNTIQENEAYRFNMEQAIEIYRSMIPFVESNEYERIWHEA